MHAFIQLGDLERHVLYFSCSGSVPVEGLVCFNKLGDDCGLVAGVSMPFHVYSGLH